MCWHCDNPEKSGLDYLQEVALPTIREHGWLVQAVGGSRSRAPFAYTVGLTEAGLPELLVTGLPALRSAELLNAAAFHYLHADPVPRHGEHLCWRGLPCTELVDVPHPEAHVYVAMNLFGDDVRAQQLVWLDDRGCWPWERGHRASRGGQPVLGPRAVRQPDVR